MASSKHYGLLVPKKRSVSLLPSVFGDDDEEEGSKAVEKELLKVGLKNKVKKQTQIAISKVLADDPTAYEYDSVYDEMEKKKISDKTILKPKDKKPKYIAALKESATARQKEFENRIERKVQKEREAEGDEFADKEAFVTSLYRQKMEERAKMEEEEKRKLLLESMMDVTKQKDLSGFYRHILSQKVGEDKPPTEPDDKEPKPVETVKETEEKRKRKCSKSRSRSKSRSKSRERGHRHHQSPNRRRNRSVDRQTRHRSHRGRFRSPERESRRRRSPERDSRRRRSPERESRRPRSVERKRKRSPRKEERSPRKEERSPRKEERREKRRSRERDAKRRHSDEGKEKTEEEELKKKRRSLKQILEIYKRRNGEKEVAEMKERFLERKRRREVAGKVFDDGGE